MSAKKDLKKIEKELARQGWRVEATKNGHRRYYAPDGENMVHMGDTPSEGRALKNLLSELRWYGFEYGNR